MKSKIIGWIKTVWKMSKKDQNISDQKIKKLMELNKDRSEALKKILDSMNEKGQKSIKKK